MSGSSMFLAGVAAVAGLAAAYYRSKSLRLSTADIDAWLMRNEIELATMEAPDPTRRGGAFEVLVRRGAEPDDPLVPYFWAVVGVFFTPGEEPEGGIRETVTRSGWARSKQAAFDAAGDAAEQMCEEQFHSHDDEPAPDEA